MATMGSTDRIPPDEVRAQVYVDRMKPLNLREQTYGIDGYLRSWWRDERLRFNSTANGGCTDFLSLTRTATASIWKPDFYWEKSLSVTLPKQIESVDVGAGQSLFVYPDGGVFWSQQVRMTISCSMDLYKLPFDTQRCEYLMGLYSKTASEVRLSWKPAVPAIDGTSTACLNEYIVTSIESDSPLFQCETTSRCPADPRPKSRARSLPRALPSLLVSCRVTSILGSRGRRRRW